MSDDYRCVLWSTAASPITHMAGTAGNEALIAREPVATPEGLAWVPALSGNALRHRLVREPGMLWLVGRLGLAGKLSQPQLYFLLNGGTLTEGGAREDTAKVAEMQRTWPPLGVLGGCLPDQVLGGKLRMWRGTLVARENAASLAATLPAGVLPARLRPAESFVEGYQYTRSDGTRSRPGLMAEGPAPAESGLMIFAGQAVVRGAAFAHGFDLPRATIEELGAVLWSLRLWRAQGGTIGGQAARGHGRLETALVAPGFDPDAAVAAYLAHVDAHADAMVAWLDAAFARRAAAPKKGAKKGSAAAEDAA